MSQMMDRCRLNIRLILFISGELNIQIKYNKDSNPPLLYLIRTRIIFSNLKLSKQKDQYFTSYIEIFRKGVHLNHIL